MYLGRLQQGQNLHLWLRTGTPDNEPGWPNTRPFYQIFRDASPLVFIETAAMASYLPGVVEGLFHNIVFLGNLYSNAGRYFVIERWIDQNGTPRQIAGSFELVGGGNASGTIIAMTEVARPDARYLLTATDAGTISRRKNPR